MRKFAKILIIVALVLAVTGGYFTHEAFYKKDTYYSSENYPSLSKNAYVGGDAYNYIINGTYFTGYCVLAGAMFVCASISFTSGVTVLALTNQRNAGKHPLNNVHVPTDTGEGELL